MLPPWEGTVACDISAFCSTMSSCQEPSLTPVPKYRGTTKKNCSVATPLCCHKPSQLKINCRDRLAASTSIRLSFTKCHKEDTHPEHRLRTQIASNTENSFIFCLSFESKSLLAPLLLLCPEQVAWSLWDFSRNSSI